MVTKLMEIQTKIKAPKDVLIRKRGDYIFIFNFADYEQSIALDREYRDILDDRTVSGECTLPVCGYLVLE